MHYTNSRSSFESLEGWIQTARENAAEHAVFVLMGNMTDKEQEYIDSSLVKC